MPSLYLVPYTIRVKDLSDNRNINPGDETGWGVDLLEIIKTYIESDMPSLPFDPGDKFKKIIRHESLHQDGRKLFGILKAGEYGIEADLLDIENNQTNYTRQTLDAELIPYFFMIKIPTNTPTGIMLFQKLGNRGFKDIFERDLSNYINGKFFGQYRIEINTLVPREMVSRYFENRIVKIRLIKYSFPREVSDVDLTGIPEDEQGEAEFVLKAHRNREFPANFLEKFRSGVDHFLGEENVSVGSILEIQNFEADNIKVEVRIGPRYRTIDLSNVDKLKFSEDITDKVRLDPATGHPDFDRLKTAAEEFLNDCAQAIWGETTDNEQSSS